MRKNDTVAILAARGAEDGVQLVRVAASAEEGIGIHVSGLPDMNTKEALLRATTAMMSCGYRVPRKKIILDISPCLTGETASLDLAIALAIMCLQEGIRPQGRWVVSGELGLDGSVRGGVEMEKLVSRVLSCTELQKDTVLIVPKSGAGGAGYAVPELDIEGVDSLPEAMDIIREQTPEAGDGPRAYLVDFGFTVRVIAPGDASDDAIASIALEKIRRTMPELVCADNIGTIDHDLECPFGTFREDGGEE